MAQAKGIPTFIHESNSFAGRSNMMLGKKATRIFTGTTGMEKFFPSSKVLVTGNPVRKSILAADITHAEGLRFFGMQENRKTILVVGGSQGARSINEAIHAGLEEITRAGLQLIWQTGRPYAAQAKAGAVGKENIWVDEFITQMEYAYSAADIVVARSGAMTVAELCLVRKPVLFVPYPFAAEDHQTVNARQLVDRGAALMIPDSEARTRLVPELIALANDLDRQQRMQAAMAPLAIADADERIAGEILKHIE
jgi:UDP-N-acetylglucosamine--N-acetylmuramyl-(pentapeptide) pyrophosphoryl-undecaprenol N-acetylglucosamine transferase